MPLGTNLPVKPLLHGFFVFGMFILLTNKPMKSNKSPKLSKASRHQKIAKSNLEKFKKQNEYFAGLKNNYSHTIAVHEPETKAVKHSQFRCLGNKIKDRSLGEKEVEKCLNEFKFFYKREVSFQALPNLRFDFYLPKNNICIEFDGIQHFQPVRTFDKNDPLAFYFRQNNDLKKNLFCKRNGIKLIRIKYTDIKKTRDILIKELVA